MAGFNTIYYDLFDNLVAAYFLGHPVDTAHRKI